MTAYQPTTATMTDFLRGMARRNRCGVEQIAAHSGWQQLAQHILTQRQEDFLRSLPEQDLQAIATGAIDLNAAAQAALSS
ncbi:MAG: hypothetical protein Q4F13_06940 [Pseudomonadota bacterium]|nr:hypothetical protein [Pseudomonadota bacterium]